MQCGEDGGWEEKRVDRLHTEWRVWGFDIAGGLKATALEAGVWVEMVTEGGRRFMAGLRKGEIL